MSRIKTWGLAALIALASAGVAPSRAHAGAVMNIKLSGSSISGNFGTTQSIPCGKGKTSTLFTFLSWNAFEGEQRNQGTLIKTLNAGVFIQQNNNCTGQTTIGFAFVDSGINLTVNGTRSATLSGQFPLSSGDILTTNLTITATGNTFQGLNHSRSNMGPVLFMTRTNSSSTEANSISGTAALNGQNIPLVNLTEVGGSISNNNIGQLLVIGARTSQ